MKRTATAFLLVAGLGGCVSPDRGGEPTVSAPNKFGAATRTTATPGMATPTGKPATAAIKRVSASSPVSGTGVEQTAGFSRVIGGGDGCATGDCGTATTGHHLGGQFGHGGGGGYAGGPDPSAYGPMANGLEIGTGHAGIFPAPAMGPWGAVAAVGAFGPGNPGPAYSDQRTQIRFVNPAGMRITWLGPNGFTDDTPLEAPARYNFPQGNVYRLKLNGIPNRPGAVFYPTLEVYPATAATITYLSHGFVPLAFTDEDFEQVRTGNLVTKVIYLPNPTYQDLAAVAGAEEIVSTRLEPGIDPVVEANRRGTILAIVRIGGIDLQDPNSPGMTEPPAIGVPVGVPVPAAPAPGAVTPGTIMPSGPTTSVPATTVPNSAAGRSTIAMPAKLN